MTVILPGPPGKPIVVDVEGSPSVSVRQGVVGPAGPTGPQGPIGIGVPNGGLVGQALLKTGASDYATGWTSAIAVDGDFLVDDGTATDPGSFTAWAAPMEAALTATVATMKLLPATQLADGGLITTKGYFSAGDGGGATYAVTTAAAFGTPDGFGDHTLLGGFVAKLLRTIFYPGQYGVGQDGSGRTSAQNKTAINAMIAKMNASTRPTAKWDGSWTANGGWSLITAAGTTHTSNGVGYITRATSGGIFKTPDADDVTAPDGVVVSNVKIDGGWDGINNLTQSTIQLEGDYNLIMNCQTFDSGGMGIKGFRSRALFNDVWDVDGGGLSVGKSTAALCFGNSVLRSGGEGIQCDEGTDTLISGNYVEGCGGVGGFGANKLNGVMWMGNHAYNNSNGGIVNGNKGDTDSFFSGMIGNVLRDNGKRGIQLRAYYTTMPVSNITRAAIPTITFPDLVVTAIDGTVTPARLTVVGHGQVSGNRRTLTGTPLATWFTASGGFPKPFKIEVIDANTLALWDEDAYLEDPVVGVPAWAAVAGSRLSHPFTRTGNPNFNREKLTFSGVVGMTEINGLSAYTEYDKTTGIVTLYANPNRNDLTGFNTSTFTAYSSGGVVDFGAVAGKMTIMSNTIGGSSTSIRAERTDPATELGHIIQGNQTPSDRVQTRTVLTRNQNAVTRAACRRPSQNNVTGNGTEHLIAFNSADDVFDTKNSVALGVFTAPTSGMYAFTGGVRMDGMGAAVTLAQLSLVHLAALPATTELFRSSMNLVPNGGVTTAGTWRTTISNLIFMEQDQRVSLRVTVTGLGADTADLVGPTETFLNINGMD